MTEHLTQIGVGGIFALMVLRLVFDFVARLRNGGNGKTKGRRDTDRFRDLQNSMGAVVLRLDRIIERLGDVAEETRAARKQGVVTGEQTERLTRAVFNLQAAIQRTPDTNPGI